MSYFDNIVFEESVLSETAKGSYQKNQSQEEKYKKEKASDGFTYHGSRHQERSTPLEKARIDKGVDRGQVLQNPKYGHPEYTVRDINTHKKVGDPTADEDTAYKNYQKAGSDSHILSYTYKKNDDVKGDKKKEFNDKVNKVTDARQYADKVTKGLDKKYGYDSIQSQSAKDAARRHYRKTHKEAVELAESLLESYQPDCIFC